MRESRLWIMFLLAGCAMFILLGVHMLAQHMGTVLSFVGVTVGDPLNFETVMGRASSLGWTIFYILLLALALYHGLYGVRAIVIELIPGARTAVSGLLLVIGLAAFVVGTYVTVISYTMGGVL